MPRPAPNLRPPPPIATTPGKREKNIFHIVSARSLCACVCVCVLSLFASVFVSGIVRLFAQRLVSQRGSSSPEAGGDWQGGGGLRERRRMFGEGGSAGPQGAAAALATLLSVLRSACLCPAHQASFY